MAKILDAMTWYAEWVVKKFKLFHKYVFKTLEISSKQKRPYI